MNPDTATGRAPLHDDDPPAPTSPTGPGAVADDLTVDPDPLGPRPAPEPRATTETTARTASAGSPIDDLYGTPYGPPPPYTTASYTADPYTSEPYSSPAPPFAPPTDRKRRRQHWAGAFLVVLGLLILGHNLGLLWWIEARYLLPLILVAAGAWLLFGRGRRG